MRDSVELWELDLRYEGHRLRDDAYEARLLNVDCPAGDRAAVGRRGHQRGPTVAQRLQTLPLRPEAED